MPAGTRIARLQGMMRTASMVLSEPSWSGLSRMGVANVLLTIVLTNQLTTKSSLIADLRTVGKTLMRCVQGNGPKEKVVCGSTSSLVLTLWAEFVIPRRWLCPLAMTPTFAPMMPVELMENATTRTIPLTAMTLMRARLGISAKMGTVFQGPARLAPHHPMIVVLGPAIPPLANATGLQSLPL